MLVENYIRRGGKLEKNIVGILNHRENFGFGKLVFFLIVVAFLILLIFVVPRLTFFSVEEKGIIDVPRVSEGTEVEYFGYKYSNTEGTLLSAPNQISCKWKSPEEDDGFKICEAVIEVELPSGATGELAAPDIGLSFSESGNVRNLEILYSKSFKVVEEVKETPVLESVSSEEGSSDSAGGLITGQVVSSEKSANNIPEPINRPEVKKAVVREKSESISKRKFDNFFDLEERSEVRDRTEIVKSNVSGEGGFEDAITENVANDSLQAETDNETDSFAIENETLASNESGGGNLLSNESYEGEEDNNLSSEEEFGDESLDNVLSNRTITGNVIVDKVEVVYRNDDAIVPKLVGLITDDYGINLSNPFAIKIRFEIPKYSENNFDIGIVTGEFEGFLDPYVSGCGDLSDANSVYYLDEDVNSSGTCFNVYAENITLDCQGNRIGYSGSSLGYGVYSNYSYTTVRNCVIESLNSSITSSKGVYLKDSVGSRVSDNTIFQSNNQGHAIFLDGCEDSIITSNVLNVTSSNQGVYAGGSSSNTFVEGNNLLFEGNEGFSAVEYFESEDLTFFNNYVNISGDSGYGVYVSDTQTANVSNNSFYFYGSTGAGAIFEAASGSSFSKNNVYLFGGSSHGVIVNGQSGFNISGNFLSISSYGSAGIYLDGAEDYIVEGNIINLITGDSGVYAQSSNNGVISNQSIAITSDGAVGIYLRESDNHVVSDSTILTQSEAPVGVILYSSSGVTVNDNSFDSDSLSPEFVGLYFDSSSDLDVYENDILSYGENSKGIYVDGTSSSDFYNNNISIYEYGGTGIHIYFSNFNNFSDTSILLDSSDSYGIYLQDINSDKFAGLVVDSLDPDSYPIYVLDNSNFIFLDSLLNGASSLLVDSGVDSGVWNFTNVAIGEISHLGDPTYILNNHWYLDVNVGGLNDSVVEGAEVSCRDKNGNLVFDELTGGGGSIGAQSVLSYSRTSSDSIEYYSNFTVNASKDNLSASQQLNLTGNDEIILLLDILPESSSTSEESSSPTALGGSGGSENPETCYPVWRCSEWSECDGGKSTRTCDNLNDCDSSSPRIGKSCQMEYEIRNILFDIGLELIEDEIPLGRNLSSRVNLLNLGVPGEVNVLVYYEITNKNGEVVQSFEEYVSLETQTEFIKEFNLDGFPEGEYALEASIDYVGQTEPAVAQASFFIGTKKESSLRKILIIAGVVLLLIAAFIFFYLRRDSPELKDLKKKIALFEKDGKSKKEIYESIKDEYKKLSHEEKEKIYPRIEEDFHLEQG